MERAKRREAETAADRARFELTRDKVIFGLELAVSGIMIVAAGLFLAFNPDLAPVMLLGGGGIGGVAKVDPR